MCHCYKVIQNSVCSWFVSKLLDNSRQRCLQVQQQYLDLYKFLNQIKLQLLEVTCCMPAHGVETLDHVVMVVKGFILAVVVCFQFRFHPTWLEVHVIGLSPPDLTRQGNWTISSLSCPWPQTWNRRVGPFFFFPNSKLEDRCIRLMHQSTVILSNL